MTDTTQQTLPPLPAPKAEAWGNSQDPRFDAYTADQMREYALATLAQQQAQVVPEGWKLVPIEPTEGMLYAMIQHNAYEENDMRRPTLRRWKDLWKVTLASAPKQEPAPAAPEAWRVELLNGLQILTDDEEEVESLKDRGEDVIPLCRCRPAPKDKA